VLFISTIILNYEITHVKERNVWDYMKYFGKKYDLDLDEKYMCLVTDGAC
jgi:hypothetical protein